MIENKYYYSAATELNDLRMKVWDLNAHVRILGQQGVSASLTQGPLRKGKIRFGSFSPSMVKSCSDLSAVTPAVWKVERPAPGRPCEHPRGPASIHVALRLSE